jgi:hypothetical protein
MNGIFRPIDIKLDETESHKLHASVSNLKAIIRKLEILKDKGASQKRIATNMWGKIDPMTAPNRKTKK